MTQQTNDPLARRDHTLAKPICAEAGWSDLDVRAVDTGRILAADAVEKVGNGHPGTAISLAPAAYQLFQREMRHDPADPQWLGRDRFVLSAGHSSLTLYVQLYLAGYPMTLDDLKALRTYESQTPGHPEYRHTPGVEITTGPLGSGFASAVGMAMAQRRQRGLFDPEAEPGTSPFDHHIYVIAGDGCLQEGVTSEASSLAGHLELGNLIAIYDDNEISIEGDTRIAMSEDVAARYRSYGWHVEDVDWRSSRDSDAGYTEDIDALAAAFQRCREVTDQPSLIILHTVIAWPSPTKKDTGKAHGSALGSEEVSALKELLGFDPQEAFPVEESVIAHAQGSARSRGEAARAAWQERFDAWKSAHPDRAQLLERLTSLEAPEGFADAFPVFEPDEKGMATRAASGKVLAALAPVMPELWGGSADLAESNNTTMEGEPSFIPEHKQTSSFSGDRYGRTLHFGIREHAMGMAMNGIAHEGLTRVYGGTFLVFSDYMRPAVRLAALQKLPVTYVWTHDSIGLGEDGPTHQPIEHLPALRAIPGLDVVRPGDANETAIAWRTILQHHDRPAGLALSRQAMPVLDRSSLASAEGVARGAYVIAEAEGGEPQVLILATGSELSLALEARDTLQAEGTPTRVISMPCREWFFEQDEDYRREVLPPHVRARVSVEAASVFGWSDLVGDAGRSVGIDHFGASADAKTLFHEFGITAESVVAKARESMAAAAGDSAPAAPGSPAQQSENPHPAPGESQDPAEDNNPGGTNS